MLKEASHYEKLATGEVKCRLCPHNCRIKPGKTGLCRVRFNHNGVLITRNFGAVTSIALDPVEKKPLYHYFPGRTILSLGSFGCNLACVFCQNYSIAHQEPAFRQANPKDVAELAVKCLSQNSIGVAYTYNEPIVWYEFILKTAPLVKKANLKNVLVTNGFINQKPLVQLLPYIDAMNIDLKSFDPHFYLKMVRGRLEPVKKTIEIAAERIHIEVTTLLVTDSNDNPEEIYSLSRWLAKISPDLPLHLSRYHPAYRFYRPPTDEGRMLACQKAALSNLKYVYLGNLAGRDNNTYCSYCGSLLVERKGYQVTVHNLRQGQCVVCLNPSPIVND